VGRSAEPAKNSAVLASPESRTGASSTAPSKRHHGRWPRERDVERHQLHRGSALSSRGRRFRSLAKRRVAASSTLILRTTTSNLIAVGRVLLEPDDPEVCGPRREQRYRLHRKRATMSVPWPLLSATPIGQEHARAVARDDDSFRLPTVVAPRLSFGD
jgi:hypothetical protein